MDLSPGEFVMRTSFAKFTAQAEKKMEAVMTEHVLVIFVISVFFISDCIFSLYIYMLLTIITF